MSAALRIEQHQIASSYMHQNDYYKSIEILQAASIRYGMHVGLVSDLIACLFITGRHFDCQIVFKKLMTEYNFVKNSLSNTSRVNTLIFISKMHEEFGQIHQCLATLEEAMAFVEMKPQYQERVFANYLRVASEYTEIKKLNSLYLSCLKGINPKSKIQAEVEHSIIMAELHLFGLDMASVRIDKLLSNSNYSAEDKKFLLFDVAEFCICKKINSRYIAQVQSYKDTKDLSAFEDILLQIILQNQKIILPTSLHTETSFQDQLRIYRLLSQTTDSELFRQFTKKIHFLLDELDYRDQALIKKKWFVQKNVNPQILIDLNVEFSKNKLFKYLHSEFVKMNVISHEKFCKDFFGEILNESHYDRIRISVKRLNDKIKRFSGVDKFFYVTKNTVEVSNEEIHFK